MGRMEDMTGVENLVYFGGQGLRGLGQWCPVRSFPFWMGGNNILLLGGGTFRGHFICCLLAIIKFDIHI